MKTKLIFVIAFLFQMTSCEKLKDATAITVNTQLTTSIPVTVLAAAIKSADLAGAVNASSFSKTQDLNLSTNTDISKYLSKINEINLSSVVITISGLSSGQTINSISLDVTGVGTLFTQTNITNTNNSFTPTVSSSMLSQLGAKLKADQKLTFTVSGNASGAMTFTIGVNMGAKFTVNTL